MWQCPKCHRSFKTRNQWHSCVTVEVEDLFLNKPPHIKDIYELLLDRCKTICSFDVDTTQSCLYFVAQHRFITIKPQKNGMILEFVLSRSMDIFPVIKIIEIGKFRFAHRMMIDSLEDVTEELMAWIEEAYLLLKN